MKHATEVDSIENMAMARLVVKSMPLIIASSSLGTARSGQLLKFLDRFTLGLSHKFNAIKGKGGVVSSRCQESNIIHTGRVFALYRDRVRLPNGIETSLDIIRHPGAAAIVPITDQGNVLLIRQYRYAVKDTIWEIPAGTVEPGESPLVCAQRELGEEIGVAAAKWHKLGEIMPLPAYSDEVIHLYCAKDHTPVQQHLDPDEILEIHEFSFNETLEMIKTGVIRDAKTISGLMMAQSAQAAP